VPPSSVDSVLENEMSQWNGNIPYRSGSSRYYQRNLGLMVFLRLTDIFPLTGVLSASVTAALVLLPANAVLAQATPLPEGEVAPAQQDLRPLTQSSSVLSVAGGERLMSEASGAIASSDYTTAVQKLQEARQVFNQLSNFYQQLASSFSGIDNRVADRQREQAVATAQMRDQATYQLALVHRAQNKPELAVPLLVQIIQSQQPTRDLGRDAYRQLYELGFVDSPYPAEGGEPTSQLPTGRS
jgi:hypothetical protein